MDLPKVDTAAADRGRHVYAEQCITCHGTQARGGQQGPNLIRSLVVLHDRYGSDLGPFLEKGHPLQSGTPSAQLSNEDIVGLANFLRQRVNDTLRGSPDMDVKNIVTGDPTAGAAFFAGAGGCTACHSATGDLAGIASREEAVEIQQRMLFPPASRGRGRGRGAASSTPTAVTVTVTPASGTPINGTLVQMDDFTVALREADGAYRSFRRTPGMKVVEHDPLDGHHRLLDTLTDRQIHDLVSYLETLK
jgi:mono/diheme cytochrome c family protein